MAGSNKFLLPLLLLLSAFCSSIISQQQYAPLQPSTALARGYSTSQSTHVIPLRQNGVAAVPGVPIVGGGVGVSSGVDFNPFLLGGSRNYPGIKARINRRGFEYFSTILEPILIQQLKQARIPNIQQCIPQVNGCILVYNIYVARFRCPSRVAVYPAPPNLIAVAIENFDIGVTGNLNGQINIILPIALTGIVQMNAHQISVRVSLAIDRTVTGGINIRVVSCQTTVGFVDVYIQNGGLIGDIANSQFRGKISEMVRSMLPSQICNQLPSIVNEKLNSKTGAIPQSISLSQMLQIALSSFGLSNFLGGGGSAAQCPASCTAHKKLAVAAAPQLPPSVVLAPPQSAPLRSSQQLQQLQQQQKQLPVVQNQHQRHAGLINGGKVHPRILPNPSSKELNNKPLPQKKIVHVQRNSKEKVGDTLPTVVKVLHNGNGHRSINNVQHIHHANSSIANEFARRIRRQARGGIQYIARPYAPVISGVPTSGVAPSLAPVGPAGANAGPRTYIPAVPNAPAPAPSPAIEPNKLATPSSAVCSSCPNSAGSGSPSDITSVILQSLDFSKLSNIYLTVQLLQTYATSYDYTIELNGEFSPGGQGGTPFGAFPMQFPYGSGYKMADILISDWTINTLFYHLHRTGFFTIRVGPETPKIGGLLKTTCSSDDELEDHGVETEEGEVVRKIRDIGFDNSITKGLLARVKRQDDGGSLADLGICFGDILPAVREKYPNKKIVILIRTTRAPSVILSPRNGGTVTLDFILNADFHIEHTNEKVGTIEVSAVIDFTVRTTGGRISGHANITDLHLRDPGATLGLPQDALDNLGNLGKELLLKAGNDALATGVPLNIPQNLGGLPISFVSPEVQIIDHALFLSSDFTIDPSSLSQLGGSGRCY